MIVKMTPTRNNHQTATPMVSAAAAIKEQDRRFIRSLYMLTAYFGISLVGKAIAITAGYSETSTLKGLGVDVALALLFVVGIPIMLVEIRTLKRVDYTLPHDEFTTQTIKRYSFGRKSSLLGVAIAGGLIATMLLTDGQRQVLQPSFLGAWVRQHAAILAGITVGIALGILVCHLRRQNIVRMLTQTNHQDGPKSKNSVSHHCAHHADDLGSIRGLPKSNMESQPNGLHEHD
jgi:hypothetical protein